MFTKIFSKTRIVLIGFGLVALSLTGLWLYAQTIYTVTWTSQTHFENNGAPNSNYTGTITATNIDTTSSPGDIKLASGIYWIQRLPVTSPPGRCWSAMSYDPDRQKTVFFGGYAETTSINDTWEWDGINWTQLNPATSPSPRYAPGMVYDAARQKTLLFGGTSNGTITFNDTWEWDGTNWTQVFPGTSPSSRCDFSMAYDADPARQKVVLFAGYNGGSTWYNDTWEWDGTNWTQVFPATSPSKRSSVRMTYDSARQKSVIFGGFYPSSSNIGDTWEYNGTTWNQMNPPISPGARSRYDMTYDSARGKTVLFGCDANGETWEWDGTDWTQINTGSAPPASWVDGDLVYDSARGKVVLFGGRSDGIVLNDTWEYPFSYPSSGTITNLKIDGQDNVCNWETISWNATITPGTSVKFRTRGADTEAGLTSAGWSSYYETSGAIITTPNSRWLEIEVLLTSDGRDTPIVHDFSITYSYNEEMAVSTTNGQSPLNVDFSTTMDTNGTVVQYEWDFDYDSVTFRPDFISNLTGDTSFCYGSPGTYTALLRVTYDDGTVIERTVEITVSASGDAPSITGIDTEPFPAIGPAPLVITFTMIAAPGAGQIEAYFWDFDGDEVIDFTSTTTNTALYTYTQEGIYTVTGKVQDSDGLMAKDDLTITVTAPLSTPPTANIITPTGPTTITVGESISFEGSGITGADGTIVKYEWDLDGDGSIDYGSTITATTSYIYFQTGTVTVTLRVTEEPSGLTGEDTVTIIVEPSPGPRVAVKQPGVPVSGKDGLRRMVKGKITVKAVSVPIPATQTLDLRYRHVGDVDALPDIFTSPADDPPEPSHADWQTTALDKSTFNTADAGAEGFITRLDTSGLLDDNWYEIIAIANYNAGTYDAWNAGQTNKRVFIYIEPDDPELDEDENQQKTKVKKDKSNEANSQGEVNVSIPYEGVTTDTDLTIGTPGLIPPMGGLSFINNYKEISLSNNAKLCKPAKIKITYPDTDDDDTVDGTTILEATLIVYRYDATDGKWEPLPGQIIDRDNNVINADAPAFSIFGMAGTPAYTGGTSTGSSGHDRNQAWYKPWSACGLLGLEAILFIFIIGFLKRRKSIHITSVRD